MGATHAWVSIHRTSIRTTHRTLNLLGVWEIRYSHSLSNNVVLPFRPNQMRSESGEFPSTYRASSVVLVTASQPSCRSYRLAGRLTLQFIDLMNSEPPHSTVWN